MKDIAIVTGASGGIGEKIAETLLAAGYLVYGIGRDFCKCAIQDESFIRISGDLLNMEALEELAKIETNHLKVLVNNAGVAWYGLHEEMNADKIQNMVRTNLEVPMLLSQRYIRILRKNKGIIINIASVSGLYNSPHGAVYGATKAGLIHFGRTLFEENRKYGMKVCTIIPDMTETNLYRNADFETSREEGAYLIAEDIADGVRYVLAQRDGVNVTELTIRPQFHRIQRKKP